MPASLAFLLGVVVGIGISAFLAHAASNLIDDLNDRSPNRGP